MQCPLLASDSAHAKDNPCNCRCFQLATMKHRLHCTYISTYACAIKEVVTIMRYYTVLFTEIAFMKRDIKMLTRFWFCKPAHCFCL